MVKLVLPRRFSQDNMSEEVLKKFVKLLGPLENFAEARTIQYMNIRMFMDNGNDIKCKIINTYNQSYKFIINEYLKGLLRTYTDGILTSEVNFEKNIDEKIEPNFDALKLERSVFYNISTRNDGKKPIGVVTRDIKLNLIKYHGLYNNLNMYKYLYANKDKYEKLMKNDPTLLDEFKRKNIEFQALPKYDLNLAVESFINV